MNKSNISEKHILEHRQEMSTSSLKTDFKGDCLKHRFPPDHPKPQGKHQFLSPFPEKPEGQ